MNELKDTGKKKKKKRQRKFTNTKNYNQGP